MPDLQLEFAQVIATLREGQDTVAEALDLLDEEGSGMATVHHLLEATRDLADQAQALVLVMMDGGANETALQDVNDLAAFFWATEDRIEAKIGMGRR